MKNEIRNIVFNAKKFFLTLSHSGTQVKKLICGLGLLKLYNLLPPFIFMKQIKRLQLGKNGLTPAFIEQVRSIFEKETLIKISILKSACRDKSDAEKIGDDLVEALGMKYDYKLVGYVLTVVKYRKAQR